MTPPSLTIVVPCYNEAEVLPETARRLGRLLASLVETGRIAPASHACFVDDGSTDATWAIIAGLNASNPSFSGLSLSRNRGHQAALVAGLMAVDGDVVISVDADLQDDLTAIGAMLAEHAKGAEIVYGVRKARTTDTAGKRLSAQLYYHLLTWLDVEIVFDHADFRLMSRKALEALRQYGETNLFLRALIPQLGFTTSVVNYDRAERFAGTSKYPFRKMLALAIEGVTSFSTRPLRIITALGLLTSTIALGLSAWALLASLAFKATVPGWASIVIPVYLICGVQLLSLGVIGEYVGKIYLETKCRPRFHIAQALSASPQQPARPPPVEPHTGTTAP